MMDAEEAERAGLVSRVVPAAELEAEALKVAGVIAAKSTPDYHHDQGIGQPLLRDDAGRRRAL
jgi:enoyl-CoA hydratase/carnithine racemase